MEKVSKLRNEKGATYMSFIVIVLLAIVLLLVIGYIYMLKNFASNFEDKSTEISNTENDKIFVEEKIQSIEKSADEKYKDYAIGLKNSINNLKDSGTIIDGEKYSSEIFDHNTMAQDKGISSINLEHDGTAYLNLDKETLIGKIYGNKYKIGSNIIKVGMTEFGQDVSIIIWMIGENGEIFYFAFNQFDAINNIEFKKIENLKNIVNIERIYNGETNDLIAVDIEGEIHSVNLL